jgi:TPR repeat protein
MMAIGRLLEVGGKNIPQDYLRAKKCYEKALAREPGLIEAMLGLARLHYFGRGMERDVGTAKQFYERVEKSGDPIALYMLGHISWNDERNLVDAREYFARCAATGHVGATMRLAELRIRCGQRISGGMKWLWALARVLFVSIRNAHDERLRMC